MATEVPATNALQVHYARDNIKYSAHAHFQDTRAAGLEGPYQDGVVTDFTGQNFYYD